MLRFPAGIATFTAAVTRPRRAAHHRLRPVLRPVRRRPLVRRLVTERTDRRLRLWLPMVVAAGAGRPDPAVRRLPHHQRHRPSMRTFGRQLAGTSLVHVLSPLRSGCGLGSNRSHSSLDCSACRDDVDGRRHAESAPQSPRCGRSASASATRRAISYRLRLSGPGNCHTPARWSGASESIRQRASAMSRAIAGCRISSWNHRVGWPSRAPERIRSVPRSSGSSEMTSGSRTTDDRVDAVRTMLLGVGLPSPVVPDGIGLRTLVDRTSVTREDRVGGGVDDIGTDA